MRTHHPEKSPEKNASQATTAPRRNTPRREWPRTRSQVVSRASRCRRSASRRVYSSRGECTKSPKEEGNHGIHGIHGIHGKKTERETRKSIRDRIPSAL